MNRDQMLNAPHERRRFAFGGIEWRDGGAYGEHHAQFTGYASVTETPYEVYGGPEYGGWNETMARGAFTRTLRANADINFLINHEGLTLARTKSRTLRLSEDKRGLKVDADLDTRMNPVQDLRIAVERGDVDEMSLGMIVTKDEWYDERGEKASWSDGTERRITEVNMNRMDVSPVNYGANDHTVGAFHAAEMALAELRDGRKINAAQRAVLISISTGMGEGPGPNPEPHEWSDKDGDGRCDVCGFTREGHEAEWAEEPARSHKTPGELLEAHMLLRDTPDTLTALLAHHELIK